MNEGNAKKRTSKIVTILIADIIIFTSIWLFYFISKRPNEPTINIVCQSNLKQFGIAFHMYAQNNSNQYPTPKQWCDLIKPYLGQNADDKVFQCPFAEEARCHYAMNPDCEPNSPPDTVLLFETEGGWNLSGGPELLTTDNHSDNRCRVLYNEGSADVISKDEIQNLKWYKDEND